MNEESVKSDIIICNRCGSEMKKAARYCMKCGNLNYYHPENENMKKYAPVGAGKPFVPPAKNELYNNVNNLKNNHYDGEARRKCVTFNIVLLMIVLLIIVVAVGGFFTMFSLYFPMLSSNPLGIIIGLSISFFISWFMLLSWQLVFQKAGEPWWGALLPIYNLYLISKIGFGNGWLFLTFIFVIPLFICFYKIGKKFYQSGLLTMLLPFVMIPVIAFNNTAEYSMLAKNMEEIDVSGATKTKSEKEYKRNKIIISIIVIIVGSVILYFTWPFIYKVGSKVYEFIIKQLEYYK